MRYRIELKGIAPLITNNGAAGLDTRSPANVEKAEISKKKGSNRTEHEENRLRELDCFISLYEGEDGAPTIPGDMLRAAIEAAAKTLKQGPQVRGGLLVEGVEKFSYDRNPGTTIDKLSKNEDVQFTVPVRVQQNRILKTRAKFDEWGVTFTIDADDEQVDQSQLQAWLDIAGRRIGIGDWRPQKSGVYGRFKTESIEALTD